MDAQPKKSLSTAIREWTQFLLLLFASIWGVYTFIYKEITAPKSAPINITLDVQARRAGLSAMRARPKTQQLIAIELKVVAKNPSVRTVFLLRNFWVAYASNVEARAADDDESTDKEVLESVNSTDGAIQMDRHSSLINTKIVASGTLFVDEQLRPGESISRTIVFRIPNGQYDQVEISTHIPTAATGGVELEWLYDSEKVQFTPKLYRIDSSSKRQEIPLNEADSLEHKHFEFQSATSSSAISLWR